MSDLTQAMAAKSDQLNAVDIMGAEPIITITRVDVRNGEQPVSVYFHGDNNRPWKPSKGMIRVLAAAWGTDSAQFVGKSVQLYFEPTVRYAGQEVGGIRIKALSHIDSNGIKVVETISRQKRVAHVIACLNMQRPAYPEAAFYEKMSKMVEAMQSGKMTLQQVIAHCQKTGDLSEQMLTDLASYAPVELDDSEPLQATEPEDETF